MEENNRDNEIIVMIHGKEVLKITTEGDTFFQGNFIKKDTKVAERMIGVIQNNLTRIIDGEEAHRKEVNDMNSGNCGTCTSC